MKIFEQPFNSQFSLMNYFPFCFQEIDSLFIFLIGPEKEYLEVGTSLAIDSKTKPRKLKRNIYLERPQLIFGDKIQDW